MNAQELSGVYLQLRESLSAIRREVDRDHAMAEDSKDKLQITRSELSTAIEKSVRFQAQLDALSERLRIAETEAAISKSRLDEATRRIDTWSTRAWSLVPIFIGAILSLSAGLIVALVKR